jgi:hypothetical protein
MCPDHLGHPNRLHRSGSVRRFRHCRLRTARGPRAGALWLKLALAFASVLLDAAGALRRHEPLVRIVAAAVRGLSLPILIAALVYWGSARGWSLWANSLLALAIVTALGPYTYRRFRTAGRCQRPDPDDCLSGHALRHDGPWLVFFGAEGSRNPSYWPVRPRTARRRGASHSGQNRGRSSGIFPCWIPTAGRVPLHRAARQRTSEDHLASVFALFPGCVSVAASWLHPVGR